MNDTARPVEPLREFVEFVADWAHDCDDDSGFYGFADIEKQARALLDTEKDGGE